MQDCKLGFWSDNVAVVQTINKQSSGSPQVLGLLRHVVLGCLQKNIHLRARHVPGHCNGAADALSRLQMELLRERHSKADTEGVRCPPFLWSLTEERC
ncbi:hypothetical protein GDO78_022182 [Eleutherodactylus coqui]|uniref:Uncharacterized protein n=1 Tax=Eleutherodactylus coqui TaxID=57060 RepID=A0A8J6AYG2_ELECQ|nr:hypothetical protein GDO78_022182 [Eleutherodactylus coqui]